MTDAPKHGEQPSPETGDVAKTEPGPETTRQAEPRSTQRATIEADPSQPGDSAFTRKPATTLIFFFAAVAAVIGVLYLVFDPSGRGERGPAGEQFAQQIEALERRVQALENRPAASIQSADTGRLEARIAALEQRPAPAPAPAAGQPGAQATARLEARIEELARTVAAVQAPSGPANADPAALQAATARIAALEQRLTAAVERDASSLRQIEESAAKLPALSERIGMLARLEQAALALRDGRKLGVIPGAPGALSQFADAAPPTEGALRLAFQQAAVSVRAVGSPTDPAGTIWERSLERMGRLVTVTKDDQVVLGDPAGTALSRARIALDSGDLAEAVRSAESLTGKQGEAMAVWLRQARGLLAARAALADMLAHAS